MRGHCGRLGPVQRHLTSITCERIPGFTPPERDKPFEQSYFLLSCFLWVETITIKVVV